MVEIGSDQFDIAVLDVVFFRVYQSFVGRHVVEVIFEVRLCTIARRNGHEGKIQEYVFILRNRGGGESWQIRSPPMVFPVRIRSIM